MADYSWLQKLDVTDESLAEYTLWDLPGRPSIWFAPGVKGLNDPLDNERARIAAERALAVAADPSLVDKEIDEEEQREKDRVVMSRYCAKKWGRAPYDIHGEAPDFTVENCYDLFKAMPTYMFDPIRNWVVNVRNFVNPNALTGTKLEKLGN